VTAPPTDGVDLLGGAIPDERLLASESAYPATFFGVNPILSLRRGDLIWFHHGADEVYDLAADPAQRADLFGTDRGRALVEELSSRLAAHFGEDPAAEIARSTLEVPSEQLASLRSLGYLGGGQGTRALQAADIRRFLEDLRVFQEARQSIRRGDGAKASAGLRALVARYPGAAIAWRELGSARVVAADAVGAEAAFTQALQRDPGDAVSALNLGNLRGMAGDAAGAERLYLRSLAAEEAQSEAHLNLGLLYLQVLDRPSDATRHLTRFLELAPGDPRGAGDPRPAREARFASRPAVF